MIMTESLAIDFMPREGTVPRILAIIGDQGFALLGIRLVPTWAADRATLRLEIGDASSVSGFKGLEDRIASLDGIIEVIHCANVGG
jgi:hypothetical protein